MTKLNLSIATNDYDHFRDFRLGDVRAEGIDHNVFIVTHHECFARVTANLMEVWGDNPVLGRNFVEGEDREGAPKVAVITHSMWENTFGSDPDVLRRTLRLNDDEYAIVGVASPRMETGTLGRARVWIPLEMTRSDVDRQVRSALVTGRLRSGVSLSEAQAEGAGIGQDLANEHPVANQGWVLQVRTTDDSFLGDNMATALSRVKWCRASELITTSKLSGLKGRFNTSP